MLENKVIESLKSRRSIRKYKSDMPSKEVIDKILEVGSYAPTGMNRQSPIIIAITNREVRDRLSKLNAKIMGRDGIDPFYGAPIILIVLVDKKCSTAIYDGSLVMGNLMNAAHALGLGSCWIHRAKEEFETDEGKKMLKSLGIEGDYEGIGHCILGYVDMELPQASPRKDDYIYRID